MLDIGGGERIPDRESVSRSHLIIDPGTYPNSALRNAEYLCVGIDDGQRVRVECRAVDDRTVVDCGAVDGEEKRATVGQWTLQAAAVFFQQKRCLLRCIRVPRIPYAVSEIVIPGAMELVPTRPGKDFNPSVAQFVVLGRKRVLIDSDFADRFFGRQLAAAESVDVNRSAARPGRGSGESLEVSRQVLWTISEGLKVAAPKHEGTGVACRRRVYSRTRVSFHGELLGGHDDSQLQIQSLHAGL